MPEEAVTFARASQAIKSSSWAPGWAGVSAVFYWRHHDYRVTFRKDAFSVPIAPAGGETGEAKRDTYVFFKDLQKWKWKEVIW